MLFPEGLIVTQLAPAFNVRGNPGIADYAGAII